MAKFKILKSINEVIDGKKYCRIDYEIITGSLVPGDVFRLYETHHYTNYSISILENDFFYALPALFIDGVYEGEILDTDNLMSGRGKGY